ncbi:MAG TPA: 2-dehydropantoate 2-reductase [Solirubrobacteraceae bacterium]|jgi:2-dehydropantoate 2-reductase|nr:2-dehydropantoate 2-reductase [Solirubrobacteraceae bacterium]
MSSDGGAMTIAVLGPGGVGGLVAGVLARVGAEVVVVAREPTAETIAERGLSVRSVMFGDFNARVRARARLTSAESVDVLIVATKAAGLDSALERVEVEPGLVLPLLNGLDHLAVLRDRFDPDTVLAGTIRVESDRPEPGVIVHTSRFLLIDMATHAPAALARMQALAETLEHADVPVRVTLPVSGRAEAQVMWSKLVRLNALACTTSAYDVRLGQIRSTPELYADLIGTIEEACAVGRAEGAEDVDPQTALAELELAHDTLGSSMQRDVAAGRPPELDAIPGAILRAAARHDLRCPTTERLVATIAARAGVPAPILAG